MKERTGQMREGYKEETCSRRKANATAIYEKGEDARIALALFLPSFFGFLHYFLPEQLACPSSIKGTGEVVVWVAMVRWQ